MINRYNNWYSNDGNDIPCLSDASDDNEDRERSIDIIIKQELIKHKIISICTVLMNNNVISSRNPTFK